MAVSLKYGRGRAFTCPVDPERVRASHQAPARLEEPREPVRAALASPLEFPPLEQLCIPGDRVVIALDRHTPAGAEIVAEVWAVLARRGVAPDGLHIIQPVALDPVALPDPRSVLPPADRDQVRWSVHDPTDDKRQAYLATTTRGERVYLDREVTDADVVISVGAIAYDPLLGYRGTSSVFYPGLSTAEAIGKARGEGHSELGPDDERPLRQTIDEVAWLLGTQFTVQVIPASDGGAAAVLAGATDAVFREGRRRLKDLWRVRLPERVDTVVVSIDADAAGHGWDQLGAALAAARNLVVRGGRVIVLSELEGEPGDGLNLIRQSRAPRAALLPIRQQAPPDMLAATQLAAAADWSPVYLLSRLPADLVEELFLTPLANERELARLLAAEGTCAFIECAQHAWGEIDRKPEVSGRKSGGRGRRQDD